MDVEGVARLLAAGDAVALDVREPFEWHAGRMPGAIHIPMGELAQRTDELPRERTIVAVCRSGNRSGTVTEALRHAGYRAVNLDGGMKAWVRAALPLELPGGGIA